MKVKQFEEVNYIAMGNSTLSEIKRDFKVMTVFMIIIIVLALIACFRGMRLAIDYEALNKEKQALEDLTEMQSKEIEELKEEYEY